MTTKTLDRTLPHDLEAERVVLGAILLHSDALEAASEHVKPEHFFRDAHRRIFATMQVLSLRGDTVEFVALKAELSRRGELDEIGGPAYLSALVDGVPRSTPIQQHAEIVRGHSDRRTLIHVANKILAESYAAEDDAADLVARAQEELFALASGHGRGGFVAVSERLNGLMETIERLHANRALVTGVATGFTDLDSMTAGLQKEDLILVASRPSMGKSALCVNIAEHVSQHIGPVGIFSLEMSLESILMRQLAGLARVDGHRLRGGFLSERDFGRLSHAFGVMGNAKLYIDDTPNLTVFEMRTRARRLKAERGLALLMVDYLQLTGSATSGKRPENRTLEVAAMSRGLKALARELKVPVVVLSQLNRGPEQRGDHRPQMSDLRESGALEADADVVLLIYREDYYAPDAEQTGIAEVIIGKQRNGPTGVVKLAFIKEFTKFENLATGYSEPHDQRLPVGDR